MIKVFIFGVVIAVFGIFLSLITDNWQVAFLISATISGISIMMISILKNASLVMRKGTKAKSVKESEAFEEADMWVRGIVAFSLPSIIAAVALYFKLYR